VLVGVDEPPAHQPGGHALVEEAADRGGEPLGEEVDVSVDDHGPETVYGLAGE